MNNDSINKIITHLEDVTLKKYDEIIDDTDKNFDRLEIFGRYSARDPYMSKYLLSFWIDYLRTIGADVSRIEKLYNIMNEKLKKLELKRGKDYRNKLFEDLKQSVEAYPGLVCYFFELDPLSSETWNDLNIRDSMEVLMMELIDDYDLRYMEEKVSILDEVLKCKYKRNIKKIMELCPESDQQQYPARFWWRHPSKFIN